MTHLELGSECKGLLLYVLCSLHFKVALSLLPFEPGRQDTPLTRHFSPACFLPPTVAALCPDGTERGVSVCTFCGGSDICAVLSVHFEHTSWLKTALILKTAGK